jgi:hypothetical protein
MGRYFVFPEATFPAVPVACVAPYRLLEKSITSAQSKRRLSANPAS